MRRLAPARITDPVCPDAAQPRSMHSTSALRRLRTRAGASGRYLTGLVAFSALLCGGTHEALAQFGPGGGLRPLGGSSPGGLGGPQGNAPSDKPEGPAEAAPTTGPTDAATEPLPQWPEEKKDKSLQFLQLHGYLRGRGFFWSNYNLGSFNDPSIRANPFTVPFSELPDSAGNHPTTGCGARNNNTCAVHDIRTADMRFRLDPTLNLSEHIRIKAQIDIFDNLVLGSTPEGFYLNGLGGTSDVYPRIVSRGQVTPESVVNTLGSSIRAKRAWGEVRIPLLEINVGRMPLMWGTGMLFHDGNCADCDFGTTVDRIMLTIRMWNHFASLSWDWAASGPTSAIVSNQMLTGWNYNLDNVAEVLQWTLAIGRRDPDEFIADALRHNKPVINYGLFAMARYQDYDLTYNPRPVVDTNPAANSRDKSSLYDPKDLQTALERRSAWTVTVDLWAKLQYKKLYLEAEGATNFGSIGNIGVYSDASSTTSQKATMQVLQFGGLARGHYKFLRDSLTVGLEVGSASGPQNGDPIGELNWRRAREKPGLPSSTDGIIHMNASRFTFDPDYHVDMILFRRILGTVYNATYFKPAVTYWLIDSFGGQAEFIYSIANRPATFPGHSINLGAEINARLMYQNKQEGFNVIIEYGVLFDLGALSQNATDSKTGQQVWSHTIPIDGTTAQAFQAKIQLKF